MRYLSFKSQLNTWYLLQDTVTTLLYDAIGDVDQKSVPVCTVFIISILKNSNKY
jgi:hypothetical protein